MRDEHIDKKLSAELRRALESDLATLDQGTRRRLQTARSDALQTLAIKQGHQPWPWLTASALAVSVLLVATVVVHNDDLQSTTTLVQFEVSAGADDLAVSEDLDFYQWLAARESSG